MLKKDIIIVDIDFTLVDSTIPYQYLNGVKETNNYDTYFRNLDRVRVIEGVPELIKTYILSGCDVCFLTSRNVDKFSCYHTLEIIEQLFKKEVLTNGCSYNVFFRAIGDTRSSVEMKTTKIKEYLKDYNIRAVFDDEDAIIEAYKNIFDLKNTNIYHINISNEGLTELPLNEFIEDYTYPHIRKLI